MTTLLVVACASSGTPTNASPSSSSDGGTVQSSADGGLGANGDDEGSNDDAGSEGPSTLPGVWRGARIAVGKQCEREKQKMCAEAQGKPGEAVACLVKVTRGMGPGCIKALGDAGYR